MSMLKKHQLSMRQGVIIERDRAMRILFKLAQNTKEGLDKKLMSAGEKHLAELRFKIAEAIIAAAQMQIMSGEDPDAKDTTLKILGSDSDAVGGAPRDPDGAG